MTEEQLRKNYIKLRAENENFMSFMEYKKLYQAPLVCEEVKDKHYKKKVEPIELIQAFDLNFSRGSIIKYVSRAKLKGNERDDLRKALYYLELEIKELDKKRAD